MLTIRGFPRKQVVAMGTQATQLPASTGATVVSTAFYVLAAAALNQPAPQAQKCRQSLGSAPVLTRRITSITSFPITTVAVKQLADVVSVIVMKMTPPCIEHSQITTPTGVWARLAKPTCAQQRSSSAPQSNHSWEYSYA